MGGDFFDFAQANEHLFLLLTDIAGNRDAARPVAARVQQVFREHARAAASAAGINDAESIVELLRSVNNAIFPANGSVRCAPTFLAIYNSAVHTLTFISAGAPIALLVENGNMRTLESCGIPLGLFTHLTHDPLPLVMESGAKLVLASKGVLESGSHRTELGSDGLSKLVREHGPGTAEEICETVLRKAEALRSGGRTGFLHLNKPRPDDLTVLALARD